MTGELIKLNPKIAFLYNLQGLILADQKKNNLAIEVYEKGLKIDPNFAMIYNNLGLLFFKKQNEESLIKAEKYYKKAISINNKIPEAHTNLGNLYSFTNKIEESIECYKNSIQINPKFSYAYFNLANRYLEIGNLKESELNLRKCIDINNNFGAAHRALSRIIKYNNKEPHFNQLNIIYEKTKNQKMKDREEYAFALAKANEDIGNTDLSFKYYKEANFFYRKKFNFSIKKEKNNFSNIKKTFTKSLFKKFTDSGNLNSNSIFILGMPRSGTTLIEQILSSHSKVYGAGEVELIPNLLKRNFVDFNKNDLSSMGDEYIKNMKNISNKNKKTTDKLPINFLSIGFIKLILPKSKIIHCYRNPKDTIISIFKNHFPTGRIKFGYDLDELVDYYNLYGDLMDYWNKTLPSFILNVKYESLIKNTKSEIEKMLKFCNLEWEDNCINFHNNKRRINTASDIQARKKIYTESINSWNKYQKYLNKHFNKLNRDEQ